MIEPASLKTKSVL